MFTYKLSSTKWQFLLTVMILIMVLTFPMANDACGNGIPVVYKERNTRNYSEERK
jgi:hypothetical protein